MQKNESHVLFVLPSTHVRVRFSRPPLVVARKQLQEGPLEVDNDIQAVLKEV